MHVDLLTLVQSFIWSQGHKSIALRVKTNWLSHITDKKRLRTKFQDIIGAADVHYVGEVAISLSFSQETTVHAGILILHMVVVIQTHITVD